MKTTSVCFIFAALITSDLPVLAQPAKDGAVKGGAERWNKVDKNRDGAITRDEFYAMPRLNKLPEDKQAALFDRLDKNGDGRISKPEMHLGKGSPADGRPGPSRIGELDKNGDGSVSFEEFQQGRLSQRLDPERQRRIFKRLDSNGDGKITPEDKPPKRPSPSDRNEGQAERPERPGPRGLIEHLDKDGDGEVTFEEFRINPRMAELDEETARKRHRALDRNRDGKVDRGDFRRRDQDRPAPGNR